MEKKIVNRIVRVSLSYDFYPDTEHEDLFEGMTQAEIVAYARGMSCDDITNFVVRGELSDALRVQVLTDEVWATDNGKVA